MTFLVYSALSCRGSADTQRGEDAVSGSSTPTLVLAGLALLVEPAELLLSLLPQAASTAISVAATPARATTLRGLLRIGCALFPIALRDTMSRTDAGDDPASWTQCDQEGESKVRASAAADVIRPYCMGTVCR
jgi:hypothetical protein